MGERPRRYLSENNIWSEKFSIKLRRRGKNIPGKRYHMCKGPGARESMAFFKWSKNHHLETT
jgi:hypothetical protein